MTSMRGVSFPRPMRRSAMTLGSKVVGANACASWVRQEQKKGKKVVFTNGCFDILHKGHISLLYAAKDFGDRLVVGLNSDASVRLLKGASRPIVDEASRSVVLSSLECVDAVVVFPEETPLELLKSLKPDVLVKGKDYEGKEVAGKEVVQHHGGEMRLIPLVENYSTTLFVDRLKKAGA